MKTIELDSSHWRHVLDFYTALLRALHAPNWHSSSVYALIDSMIWGGINEVEPPFVVRITKTKNLPTEIRKHLESLLPSGNFLAKERLRSFNISQAEGKFFSAIAAFGQSVFASPRYVLERLCDEFLSSRCVANGIQPRLFLEQKEVFWR